MLTTAGAMTTRYPAQTTARQTQIAPQAPGVTMPAPAQQAVQPRPLIPIPPATFTNPMAQFRAGIRSNIQANRVAYQDALAQARMIQDPVARRQALLQAKQIAQATYRNIRSQRPQTQQQAFQQDEGGFQDVRGDALQQAPAAPPTRFQAAFSRPGAPAPTGPSPIQQPTGARPSPYPLAGQQPFGPTNTSNLLPRPSFDQGVPTFESSGNAQVRADDRGRATDFIRQSQTALLGPLAPQLGLGQGSNFVLTRGDIPLLEAGLNFENVLLAERDRELGYGELARTQAGVGADPQLAALRNVLGMQAGGMGSPEMNQALSLALARAGRQPQFERQQTATRDQYTRDSENAIRDLREDYARRGLSGSEISFDEARLRQEGSSALNRALADLEAQQDESSRQDIGQLADLAGQRDAFQQQSIEQLLGELSRQDSTRTGLGQLLANVFLETERQPFDFSGLTTPLKDKVAAMPVSGPLNVRLPKYKTGL